MNKPVPASPAHEWRCCDCKKFVNAGVVRCMSCSIDHGAMKAYADKKQSASPAQISDEQAVKAVWPQARIVQWMVLWPDNSKSWGYQVEGTAWTQVQPEKSKEEAWASASSRLEPVEAPKMCELCNSSQRPIKNWIDRLMRFCTSDWHDLEPVEAPTKRLDCYCDQITCPICYPPVEAVSKGGGSCATFQGSDCPYCRPVEEVSTPPEEEDELTDETCPHCGEEGVAFGAHCNMVDHEPLAGWDFPAPKVSTPLPQQEIPSKTCIAPDGTLCPKCHPPMPWPESGALPQQEEPATVKYLAPGDSEPVWLLVFEDADRGNATYHSEIEGREAFARATVNWNCTLFAPVPIAPLLGQDEPCTDETGTSYSRDHWKELAGEWETLALKYFGEKTQALTSLAAAQKEIEEEQGRRTHTQEWYAKHYGKLQDWARKVLPEPHRNQFFNCVANGTYDHMLDVGEPYTCKAGFRIVPTNYFKMDTAEGQIIRDQTSRAELAEASLAEAQKRIAELESAAMWALGYTDFRPRREGEGAYWWRSEFRTLAFPDAERMKELEKDVSR